MRFLKRQGRYLVAAIALTIAFALSVQLGERGVQFDLRHATVEASEPGSDEYRLSSIYILNRVILQLTDNYVEPERINPTEMFYAALDAVQAQIPELVISYDRDSDPTSTREVKVQVASREETFQVHHMESLWEMSLRIKTFFEFIEAHLPPDPDRKAQDIEYAAINGMLTTLDPHSALLPPTHYEEMQTRTGGQFGGLGVVISIRDGALTVISPVDGTPAARTGIRAQDTIVRIGEESTVNMNLNEAVSRLRGEPGTDVDLWIQRANWSEPRQFTITREIIRIESVTSQALNDKIGYLRISDFQANTLSDVRTHLEQLRQEMGGLQGLVLDVRDNPGGLLDQSIRISDLFLNRGTIVSTVGVGNTLRETREASSSGTEPDYPIVVLVNGGSASASEIVAGALQKNDRAIVLGDTSFGKGTVQILYEFPDDSALKLTVAQYLTPGGVSIQNTGIIPDLHTIPVEITPEAVNLFLSQSMQRERDMDRTLSHPSTSEGTSFRHIRYLDESDEDDEFVSPDEFVEDFEIRLATRLLARLGESAGRQKFLDASQGELEVVFNRELSRIQSELSDLGVDWSSGESPRNPDIDFSVSTSASPAQAGDPLEITASLTNRSSQPLFRAKAITRSDNPLLRHREFVFGRVEPGETKEWTVTINLPKDARNRHDRIFFALSDDEQGFGSEEHFDLRIAEQERPQYGFSYEFIDDNDGVLRAGDEVTLRMHLTNHGSVEGGETSLYLKNMTGRELYLERGRGVINDLAPGATEHVDFLFEVRDVPEDGVASLEIDIYDATYRSFVQKQFRLPVETSERNLQSWRGMATVNGSATLHVGAHEDTDLVSTVSQGATLPVNARSGDWLRVAFDDRTAWIKADQVSAREGASGSASGFDGVQWFSKPRVSLRPERMLTSSPTVLLEGLIEDVWTVKDYYVIVQKQEGRGRFRSRKVNYSPIGTNRAEFSDQIPLFEGMNRISLVTRNEAGISHTETIFVYRE